MVTVRCAAFNCAVIIGHFQEADPMANDFLKIFSNGWENLKLQYLPMISLTTTLIFQGLNFSWVKSGT